MLPACCPQPPWSAVAEKSSGWIQLALENAISITAGQLAAPGHLPTWAPGCEVSMAEGFQITELKNENIKKLKIWLRAAFGFALLL